MLIAIASNGTLFTKKGPVHAFKRGAGGGGDRLSNSVNFKTLFEISFLFIRSFIYRSNKLVR